MKPAIIAAFVIALSVATAPVLAVGVMDASTQNEYLLGRAALGKSAFTLAIDHFSEAQKLCPDSPELLLSLASANDHAARMVPAICWYRAYILVESDNDNYRKATNRVTALEVMSEKSIDDLFAQSLRATRQAPPVVQSVCYFHVATRLAESGKIDQALELLPKISADLRQSAEQQCWLAYAKSAAIENSQDELTKALRKLDELHAPDIQKAIEKLKSALSPAPGQSELPTTAFQAADYLKVWSSLSNENSKNAVLRDLPGTLAERLSEIRSRSSSSAQSTLALIDTFGDAAVDLSNALMQIKATERAASNSIAPTAMLNRPIAQLRAIAIAAPPIPESPSQPSSRQTTDTSGLKRLSAEEAGTGLPKQFTLRAQISHATYGVPMTATARVVQESGDQYRLSWSSRRPFWHWRSGRHTTGKINLDPSTGSVIISERGLCMWGPFETHFRGVLNGKRIEGNINGNDPLNSYTGQWEAWW